MYKNKELTIEKPLIVRVKECLTGLLGVGMMIAATHGAFFGGSNDGIAPADFKSKVVSELHTHSDIQLQHNRIVVDPKSLRSVRSDGDKTAEGDSMRGGWDAYCA
jgi:hypothetical protein